MKSQDIAKLAGVSRSTVSRVINNYPNVPKETREKVMKVIKEHNYVPNTFARTLAGKKSNTIGLFFIITGETFEDNKIARNDYFSSYLNYLVDVANGMNYYVLVNTVSVTGDYDKVNRAFLEKRIDGGVIIGTQSDTLSRLQFKSFDAPMVIIDYDFTSSYDELNQDYKNMRFINSDDHAGIDKAVNYLMSKGHKDIGFIRGNDRTRSARVRYDGYLDAMEKYRLPVDEAYIIDGEFSPQIARDNINKAIQQKKLPTAFISSNDYMAIEAMKILKDSGYKVPEDISIIGFDNVSMSEQTMPPLTTMAPKYQEMAKEAISTIDKVLKSERKYTSDQVFDVELIERQSC